VKKVFNTRRKILLGRLKQALAYSLRQFFDKAGFSLIAGMLFALSSLALILSIMALTEPSQHPPPSSQSPPASPPNNPTPNNNPQNNNPQTNNAKNSNVQNNNAQNSSVQNSGVKSSNVQNSGAKTNNPQNNNAQNSGVQNSSVKSSNVQNSGVQTNNAKNNNAQNSGAPAGEHAPLLAQAPLPAQEKPRKKTPPPPAMAAYNKPALHGNTSLTTASNPAESTSAEDENALAHPGASSGDYDCSVAASAWTYALQYKLSKYRQRIAALPYSEDKNPEKLKKEFRRYQKAILHHNNSKTACEKLNQRLDAWIRAYEGHTHKQTLDLSTEKI